MRENGLVYFGVKSGPGCRYEVSQDRWGRWSAKPDTWNLYDWMTLPEETWNKVQEFTADYPPALLAEFKEPFGMSYVRDAVELERRAKSALAQEITRRLALPGYGATTLWQLDAGASGGGARRVIFPLNMGKPYEPWYREWNWWEVRVKAPFYRGVYEGRTGLKAEDS